MLFSEIRDTSGGGLGEGRKIIFSVLDIVSLQFLKHSCSSSRHWLCGD